MANREYAKAFKLLTQRLRDSTNDQKARLGITFTYKLRPHILYRCNSQFRYFLNSYGDVICGNKIIDSRITDSSYAHFYSVGNLMKGFTKEDFMKMWIDNAIGNDLCIYYEDAYFKPAKMMSSNLANRKLLDSNDTVESLCVQYDMTQA